MFKFLITPTLTSGAHRITETFHIKKFFPLGKNSEVLDKLNARTWVLQNFIYNL